MTSVFHTSSLYVVDLKSCERREPAEMNIHSNGLIKSKRCQMKASTEPETAQTVINCISDKTTHGTYCVSPRSTLTLQCSTTAHLHLTSTSWCYIQSLFSLYSAVSNILSLLKPLFVCVSVCVLLYDCRLHCSQRTLWNEAKVRAPGVPLLQGVVSAGPRVSSLAQPLAQKKQTRSN